ncbi:hypothetical protein OG225_42735 (plasmid) [Nocardia sp. NBC_01377]|uniref:hypothetical protein n=1 Tax=Nocardia sp. NBC_01377 TaxID=2903595 RepID=UPI002F919C6F
MMRVDDEGSAAVLEAVDAARGIRRAGPGLVVVLFRGSAVAATMHFLDTTDTPPLGTVANALGTDRAVLIVVGSTKVVGPIIHASDVVAAWLGTARVAVTARIHVRALTDGAMIWTDMSTDGEYDGSGVPATITGEHAVRSWRRRR